MRSRTIGQKVYGLSMVGAAGFLMWNTFSPQAEAARQAKKEQQKQYETWRENGRYQFMKAAEERKARLTHEKNNTSCDSTVSNKM